MFVRGGVDDTRFKDTKKFWGQGQTLSRPRPSTQTQVFSKKKRSSKFFSGDLKKKVFKKFFQAKKDFKKICLGDLYLKKPKQRSLQIFREVSGVFQRNFNSSKIVLSSSRGQGNFRGLEASRPRPRTSKRVLEESTSDVCVTFFSSTNVVFLFFSCLFFLQFFSDFLSFLKALFSKFFSKSLHFLFFAYIYIPFAFAYILLLLTFCTCLHFILILIEFWSELWIIKVRIAELRCGLTKFSTLRNCGFEKKIAEPSSVWINWKDSANYQVIISSMPKTYAVAVCQWDN